MRPSNTTYRIIVSQLYEGDISFLFDKYFILGSGKKAGWEGGAQCDIIQNMRGHINYIHIYGNDLGWFLTSHDLSFLHSKLK